MPPLLIVPEYLGAFFPPGFRDEFLKFSLAVLTKFDPKICCLRVVGGIFVSNLMSAHSTFLMARGAVDKFMNRLNFAPIPLHLLLSFLDLKSFIYINNFFHDFLWSIPESDLEINNTNPWSSQASLWGGFWGLASPGINPR